MSMKEDPLTFTSSSSSSPITFSDTLIDTTNSSNTIGSASGSFQGSDNILYEGSGGGDADFGFFRPDFRQKLLVDSILLSCTLKTRLTICEGRDGTETSNGDVLIFPDMIRYRRLTHFDIDTFVEEVLIKDGEWLPGNPEKLKGSYIFVCCHGSRDRRCGVCGPPLVARFKDEVELHGLQGKVSISPCSHVGGHKYAGNVIIFGCSINGEISGHWYGYVTLDDVPKLLEQHFLKGEIVESLWRGQMGLSEDEQQRAQELRLQNSDGTKTGRSNMQNSTKLPEIAAQTCGLRADTNGCHQANGNGRCCQMSPSVEKNDNPGTIIDDNKVSAGKKAKKQLLRNNSQTGAGKRKVCSMPTWFESWERDDTYAALAVVCATVCVGVAYSCYKQL
ncbi:hypothetical protein KSS87_021250 [Heliosperma pusillum]|nr:hypothetical protein KSS87_021250 [Heliosperma pusillum]